MLDLNVRVLIPSTEHHQIAMAAMAVRYGFLEKVETPPQSGAWFRLTDKGKRLLQEGQDATN